MPHGSSWFKFLPGYEQLVAYFSHNRTFLENAHVQEIQHVLAALLVFVVVLLLSVMTRSALTASADKGLVPPTGFSVRNFIEVLCEALYKQMVSIIGPEARRYFPVIGTLALFIFFSNLLGLIPGFTPPTDNWNTTLACGGFVFLYYNFHGLRVNGFNHIAHMANPIGTWWGWFLAPIMFPIELIGHVARPMSLSLRLMGNMIGDHAVLGIFVSLVPFLVPLPSFILGLVVCVVQTLVFCLLSMVYISLAVQHSHDESHGHDAAHGHAH